MRLLVWDPAKPRWKYVWVTPGELELINMIRIEKGIGPVLVLARENGT